jgi:hypothetical protein
LIFDEDKFEELEREAEEQYQTSVTNVLADILSREEESKFEVILHLNHYIF